mgnify:CR=1 FL=1
MYASDELVSTNYLKENKCAFVVTEKDKLKDTLYISLNDDSKRKECINNAYEVSSKNHNIMRNSEIFKKFIIETLNNK